MGSIRIDSILAICYFVLSPSILCAEVLLSEERKRQKTDDSLTESVGDQQKHSDISIDRIGNFRIEATLGTGGMGSVYRAYDETMKRTVALKVLHSSLQISGKSVSRFTREAWIAGQLEHDGIVRVYSRGEDRPHKYIAMEYADGGSLARPSTWFFTEQPNSEFDRDHRRIHHRGSGIVLADRGYRPSPPPTRGDTASQQPQAQPHGAPPFGGSYLADAAGAHTAQRRRVPRFRAVPEMAICGLIGWIRRRCFEKTNNGCFQLLLVFDLTFPYYKEFPSKFF